MPFDRSRWLQYLPYVYSDHPFLGRYMLIFEDLFGPLDQTIAHFDLFLDPHTAPESYLSILADWLGLVLDDRWPAERRRAILRSAVEMYDFRGTRKGLTQLLEASTECAVDVAENTDGPHTFRVVITLPKGKDVDEQMVRHLIDTNKPAHTVYKLQIKKSRRR
jgi:phage tail-like protein